MAQNHLVAVAALSMVLVMTFSSGTSFAGAWGRSAAKAAAARSKQPASTRSSLVRAATATSSEESEPSSDDRPIVAVIGANGKTGGLVVTALAKAGVRTRALTRSGRWTPPEGSSQTLTKDVEVGQADVTDAASLAAALAGTAAVVFAAAFSRGKSSPKEVDNAGLVNTAKAVADQGVGRLVVVSSAATTRPYAPVGVLLNTVGSGVLLEKLQGEREMRGILRGSGATYTVVRPGGLKMGDASGTEVLEFNQGDTFVGSVQRADVAAVCAVAATDPENRGAGKTFEMYESSTRSGLMPWYGSSKYTVAGRADCGAMLGALLDDEQVTDVPGFLPF